MDVRNVKALVLIMSLMTGLSLAKDSLAEGCGSPAVSVVDGIIQSIAVDPKDGDTAYAYGRGVYKSCDGGATWHAPSGSFVGRGMTLDPGVPGALYAGSQYDGIYVSRDGAGSWSRANYGLTDDWVDTIALAPDGRLYAGTVSGIFVSEDSAGSWRLLSGSPSGEHVYGLVADPTNANNLYAGIFRQGVYRSTDAGTTWLQSSTGLTDHQVFDLDIHPADPSVLYASTFSGVYRSVDAGATWSEIGDLFTVSELAVSPQDPSILFVSTEQRGLYRSKDGGENWVMIHDGIGADGTPINFVSIAVAISGRVYVGTVHAGVYHSRSGGDTWMSSGHSNSGGGGSTVGDGSPGGHPVSALSVNIQKYGEDDSVGAGGLAKFKVTISNTSDIASPDVEIDIGWWRDWAGRTYAYDIAVNPSHADCFQPKRCRLGTIPAGGSKVVDINGETEAGVLTMYNFRVTATAADGATATGTIRVGSSVTLLEIGGGGATGIWSLSLLLSTWLVRGLRRPNRVLERIVAFDRVGRFAAGPIVSRSAPPRDGSPSSAGPPAGRCPLIPRHFPESS